MSNNPSQMPPLIPMSLGLCWTENTTIMPVSIDFCFIHINTLLTLVFQVSTKFILSYEWDKSFGLNIRSTSQVQTPRGYWQTRYPREIPCHIWCSYQRSWLGTSEVWSTSPTKLPDRQDTHLSTIIFYTNLTCYQTFCVEFYRTYLWRYEKSPLKQYRATISTQSVSKPITSTMTQTTSMEFVTLQAPMEQDHKKGGIASLLMPKFCEFRRYCIKMVCPYCMARMILFSNATKFDSAVYIGSKTMNKERRFIRKYTYPLPSAMYDNEIYQHEVGTMFDVHKAEDLPDEIFADP